MVDLGEITKQFAGHLDKGKLKDALRLYRDHAVGICQGLVESYDSLQLKHYISLVKGSYEHTGKDFELNLTLAFMQQDREVFGEILEAIDY